MAKRLLIEADVKAAIIKVLKAYEPHVFFEMWVPFGYGKRGLDFNVSAWGRALYIEAKAPGKQPTPGQRQTLKEAHLSGATCFIISNAEEVAALDRWLARLSRQQS